MSHAVAAKQMERSVGTITQAAIAEMHEQLPWFRALSAEDRSWIGVIAGKGISSFVDWLRDPSIDAVVTANIFGSAPRELTGVVTLQQTVEMVRTTIGVVEQQVEAVVGVDDARDVREADAAAEE